MCVFKQRHRSSLLTVLDQVFFLSLFPSFSLLNSIYPSSIVITKCHRIPCVRQKQLLFVWNTGSFMCCNRTHLTNGKSRSIFKKISMARGKKCNVILSKPLNGGCHHFHLLQSEPFINLIFLILSSSFKCVP